MRLVLLWSTGEYDDYAEHVIPFEWDSVEDLFCLIEDKKAAVIEHQDRRATAYERPHNSSSEAWEEFMARVDAYDKEDPGLIKDIWGHELDVSGLWSYGHWSDVEILTLDEWFTR